MAIEAGAMRGGEGRQPDVAARDATGEAGFSLVELMIGVVLMIVGLVGIMTSTIRLHSLQKVDTELGHAFRACRTNLEELRTVPLSTLPTLDGTGFDVLGPDGRSAGIDPVPGDPDGLPGEIHVTLDQSTAVRSLYRIRVVVTWDAGSRVQSVELETLRGGRP